MSSVVLPPPSIHDLASLANLEHEECEASLRDGLHHALRAGEYLTQAKALCAHGEWLPWLREHFTGSERLAQAYMKVARDPQRVAGLTFRDALRELADPASKISGAVMSSATPEWYTPPEIIDAAQTVLGSIDLDPCSNDAEEPNVPATVHYARQDDGLSQRWAGTVYMNPPFGKAITAWLQKLVDEHRSGGVPEAVALVPARVDTQWWQIVRDYPVCFIEGRLQFVGAETGAPFPSAVLYLGPDVGKFVRAFGALGNIYTRLRCEEAV